MIEEYPVEITDIYGYTLIVKRCQNTENRNLMGTGGQENKGGKTEEKPPVRPLGRFNRQGIKPKTKNEDGKGGETA